MGTYSKSTFGKIAGAVGEGVGSSWRGIKVIRSLPTKSGKPATALQLAVYARLALSAAYLSPIKDILNIGFGDKKLKKITGYNAAVRAFLDEAITGNYPDHGVDLSKIRMSKGALETAEVSMRPLENNIVLSWPVDITNVRSFVDDKMIFVIFNENKNTYKLNNSFTRNDGEISIPFPGKPNDLLHIWSFCAKRDEKMVSNSVYLGTIIVPFSL